MGSWRLESVHHQTQTHDTAELFGNHYVVSFRLRYTPSTLGAFKETPNLEWNEVIMMNDHGSGEHWVFQTNMYDHNPLSNTLKIWAERYHAAYDAAAGVPRPGYEKGSARIQDKNGRPLTAADLGTGMASKKDKADAVRDYLKRKGGLLFIEIDDIPSINIPKPGDTTHKERLLLFDCGVAGGGPRTKAAQYLDVNGRTPKATWTREFDLIPRRTGLKTSGLRTVAPPVNVSMVRPPLFSLGDYK